jgi:hypothetical protein
MMGVSHERTHPPGIKGPPDHWRARVTLLNSPVFPAANAPRDKEISDRLQRREEVA